MATDYEQIYRGSRDALGPPTQEFVRFFESLDKKAAWVLDVGCGQGRDALFIARLGYRVTGVDQAPSGIRQLQDTAKRERLAVDAIVADIRTYVPRRNYDVVVIDRTLHMLDADERSTVLRGLLDHTGPNGHVLIADERSNIPALRRIFDDSPDRWDAVLERRGFLFMARKP